MRNFTFLVILQLFAAAKLLSNDQSSTVTGTIIGTKFHFDYTIDKCTPTDISANAFDGKMTSVFATCDSTKGWVGLDLGEKHVITGVAYCPQSKHNQEMVLGLFEGANNPDFGDAIPLLMVTTAPPDNTMTIRQIDCSQGFRYLRYVGPENARCSVAELEFYGYKGAGNTSHLPQITNIPSVIIHTANAQDITDKDIYIPGIISIISENGTILYTDSLNIKGRGNATWNYPKKPYKIKLRNPASLIGMPAIDKEWTLTNNYSDKTLMRSLLAFDLSKRLDMPYTPAAKPVDVFINGDYKGTYHLCDQIEVETGRVPVEKMKRSTVTLPDLSGGYLIEMDAYAYTEISNFTSFRNCIPVTIKYPKEDEIIPAQSEYIKKSFGLMEKAVFSSDYTNPEVGYRKYIDPESFIRYFLVGEITGNTDTYWETYMYKKRDNDKFYFGPAWDFDMAFENDCRTYPINNNPEWIYASTGSSATGVRDLINRVFSDSTLRTQLRATYANYRNSGKISTNALVKVVDDYELLLDHSQKLNFKRWDILNTMISENPQALGSYSAEVDHVRNYIKSRIAWMDNKLSYITDGLDKTLPSTTYLWTEGCNLHIEGLSGNTRIRIADVCGRIIVNQQADTRFSATMSKGVYLVEISDNTSGTRVLKCQIR